MANLVQKDQKTHKQNQVMLLIVSCPSLVTPPREHIGEFRFHNRNATTAAS
jgi:hypothetical protein